MLSKINGKSTPIWSVVDIIGQKEFIPQTERNVQIVLKNF